MNRGEDTPMTTLSSIDDPPVDLNILRLKYWDTDSEGTLDTMRFILSCLASDEWCDSGSVSNWSNVDE